MYDELIKRLRTTKVVVFKAEDVNLLQEAADAIEELQDTVDGLAAQTNMVLEETEGRTVIKFEPKWVPVTERLPEDGVDVLTFCPKTQPIGGDDYLSLLPKQSVLENLVDINHLKDGEWYYSWRRPTHWMPLPSAPKEDDE